MKERINFALLEDLHPKTKEEIYPDYHGDPPPLQDEEYFYDITYNIDKIIEASRELEQELNYIKNATPVIRKMEYLQYLIKRFGSHRIDCKYLLTVAPRIQEEHALCDCGWEEIRMKLKTRR